MIENIRLLHVCKQDLATSLQRSMVFDSLRLKKDTIYTFLLDKKISFYKKIWNKVIFRFGFYPEYNKENKKLLKQVKTNIYDIVFIEKGVSIKPSTLKKIKKHCPKCKLVSYTLDDMMNPNNSSLQYKFGIKYYDYNFTNKKYNVIELKNIGAKNVFYFRNAFCSLVHRPVSLKENEKEYYESDVSFIGTYEKHRSEILKYIANSGIKIKIWGWGFKFEFNHKNIEFMSKHVYGDEYAKVVCASKINLCFLRKANRDTETTRSVELPACGGFMLAERTQEHQELFVEGREAEYFETKEEIVTKIEYFLKYENKRKKIAQQGYNKCIRAKYDYKNQLREIIKIVLNE